MFAKLDDGFPDLVYGMGDVRAFQLYIPFLVFIHGTKHVVALHTFCESSHPPAHALLPSFRIVKSGDTAHLFELDDGVGRASHTTFWNVPHIFSRASKSLAISIDAPSKASAEMR